MNARPVRGFVSIRWIVAGAAAVLVTISVLGVTAVTERRTREVLVREIEARLMVQARSLAVTSTGALVTQYPELTLAPLLTEMRSRQPELEILAVVDRSGTIQGHFDVRRIGSAYVSPRGLTEVATSAPLKPGESLAGNAAVLVATAPVVDTNGDLLGKALVGLRRSHVDAALAGIARPQLLVLGALLAAAVLFSFSLMSILLRPIETLRAGIERIGRGELNAPVQLKDRTEFGLLAGAVNDMASELRSAQAETMDRARLAHEMELAQEVLGALLPSRPAVAGEFVVLGKQWSAAEVGGDFYDVQSLPDGTVAISIADVAGKGLAGCMVASMIFSLTRALRPLHESPASLLAALDERMAGIVRRGTFVTMFYGVLDPRTGALTYASAGHNPVLHYRARERRVEWHETKGIPLGAIRGGAIRATLEDTVLELSRGDLLVQSTDGINEAAPAGSEKQFGFDGMERLVLQTAHLGAQAVADGLHRAVEHWRQGSPPGDDETVLIVSREGSVEQLVPAAGNGNRAIKEEVEAMNRLAAAEKRGQGLRVVATLDTLDGIEAWLTQVGANSGVDAEAASLLHLALYEVCANIAEHGHGNDPAHHMEIWWTPNPRRSGGTFTIRDHAPSFDPGHIPGKTGSHPQVRKRGRGLGLEIIHRVMSRVHYHPDTKAGNLTVLEWDPGKKPVEREEIRHA